MKKAISLFAVVMFSVAAFAQDTTLKNNPTMSKDTVPNIGKDSALRNGANGATGTGKAMDSTATGSTSTLSTTMDTARKMQQTTSDTTASTTDTASRVIPTDRVIMKDDKMYMVKSGDSSLLEKSYKLESGAIVSTTGMVKYPSGKSVQLKNGQFIELKPKTITAEAKKTTATKKSTTVTKKKTS